ncbi:outer membrane protein transport protein [Psychrobacter sp. I-STPA6b]|uniref:outer membrane protein transport protein n=1 Tax=Psychrobacter sp. I-STPA6b TaxID=2585718 RepID=UPI001D0C017F|nr:outer membrane protein transport protein [Psychrobacter sp. I-STPA6b]
MNKHILAKQISLIIGGCVGIVGISHAAGLEYTKQSVAPLFEEGNYAELSYAYVDPKMEGKDVAGNRIDDVMDDFNLSGAAVKIAPTADTALALIYEEPFGVDTIYPKGSIFHNEIGATEARVRNKSLTLLGKGNVTDNFSIYGGLEYQTIKGHVTGAQPVGLPTALAKSGITAEQYAQLLQQAAATGNTTAIDAIHQLAASPTLYSLDFDNDHTFVPVVGMAYEKPEIALRAAVTYRAPATYQMSGKENLQVVIPVALGGDGVTPTPAEAGLPMAGKTEVKFPQSVNLDFQTGLSEKHQLLGMVNARWVNWSKFEVSPPLATQETQEPLASYPEDGYSVEVALGKQFTPQLSGEVRLGYDHGTGQPLSLLGPYGAVKTAGIGAKYQFNKNLSVSAGGQYMWLDGGDIETKADGKVATIDDGSGYALGMKVGYHF